MSNRIGGKKGGKIDDSNGAFAEDIVSPLLSEIWAGQPKKPVASTKSNNTVSTDSHGSEDLDQTRKTEEEDSQWLTSEQLLKSGVVILVSMAGVAASFASFIVSPAIIVYVSGALCVMNASAVLYKQKQIFPSSTLRNKIRGLRVTKERLDEQVGFLNQEIDELNFQGTSFEGVEEDLQKIIGTQLTSIEELVSLVKENEDILISMRENLRQKIIQDVIAIVIRTDGDNDLKFDKVEAKLLALKISVKLEVYGVIFDEEKFMRAVSLNPTVYGVLSVVKKLLPGEDEEQEIEELDEDDIYDMFYMSRDEQKRRGSVLAVRATFAGKSGVSLSRLSDTAFRRHSICSVHSNEFQSVQSCDQSMFSSEASPSEEIKNV